MYYSGLWGDSIYSNDFDWVTESSGPRVGEVGERAGKVIMNDD